ncbi:MAG TPA: metal ABC transporter permease, partial [Candidatus Acidoferrales bacterium]|nr:metal ABC transporter permease [Candidatus Acidoferrales bacterium]
VGDALSHVALPGLALGILFNFNPFIGAFAFLFAASMVTWYIERSTELSAEAIIGVLFVLALAIGILITPEPDLLEALFGDVAKVSVYDALAAVTVSIFVLILVRWVYLRTVLSLISEELARSSGINVSRINFVYLLLVALVVASGIKLVGSLLVGALVIVPAAATKNIGRNLHSYAMISGIVGILSSLSGIVLSYYTRLPAGPLVVLAGTLIFLITVFWNRLSA